MKPRLLAEELTGMNNWDAAQPMTDVWKFWKEINLCSVSSNTLERSGSLKFK